MQVQEIYIVVKGHSIKKSLADTVQARILARVKVLSDYPAYKLEKLCGYDFWESLPKEEHTHAGIFVSHQVEMGDLPLRHVLRKHEYPKYYRIDLNLFKH
ncbi:MAG TPA: hypothetical protein PK056_06830 [Methylotenera sp.]|nr:hypothetical protein [Methylotenera sp.]